MSANDFFGSVTLSSSVKITIVTKYFKAWSTVMNKNPHARHLGYVDLFAGPGQYEDGSFTTAKSILTSIAENQSVSGKAQILLNDKSTKSIQQLQQWCSSDVAVSAMMGNIEFINQEVDDGTVSRLQRFQNFPTFYFLDPWGYKGLSHELLATALGSYGSECVLFFNYNRVNPAINHQGVKKHVLKLLGALDSVQLEEKLSSLPSQDREQLILKSLESSLRNAGANHVIGFRFHQMDRERTSHYLVFATKSATGHRIMSEIMAKESDMVEGIPIFGLKPRKVSQQAINMGLFWEETYTQVSSEALKYLSNGSATVYDVMTYVTSLNSWAPLSTKTVKRVLLQMEEEGRIIVDLPRVERPLYKGEPTLGPYRKIRIT